MPKASVGIASCAYHNASSAGRSRLSRLLQQAPKELSASDTSSSSTCESVAGSRPELEVILSRFTTDSALQHFLSSRRPSLPRLVASSAEPSLGIISNILSSSVIRGLPAVVAESPLRATTLSDLVGSVSSTYWVAQGGQGTVLVAKWQNGSNKVAVKWLVADAAEVPAALLEGFLSKTLSHPHLLRTFDSAVCTAEDPAELASVLGSTDSGGQTSSTAQQTQVAFMPRAGRPVDCRTVLKHLSAGPGKVVVRIVSEWCDGGTLHAAIRRGVFRADGERSAACAQAAMIDTAVEIAQALRHLHSRGVIHGDLKPGNVLLQSCPRDACSSRGFVAKLADFGLSRVLLSGPAQGQKRQQQQREDGQQAADADADVDDSSCCRLLRTCECATVSYMAPEYLNSRLGTCSDIYSFGVVLWEMITGRAPFQGFNTVQVMYGVGKSGDLALEWPAATPAPLLRLGQACCRREPAERPSVQEVLLDLMDMKARL